MDERIEAMAALQPEGVRDISDSARARTLDPASAASESVDALVMSSLRLQRS